MLFTKRQVEGAIKPMRRFSRNSDRHGQDWALGASSGRILWSYVLTPFTCSSGHSSRPNRNPTRRITRISLIFYILLFAIPPGKIMKPAEKVSHVVFVTWAVYDLWLGFESLVCCCLPAAFVSYLSQQRQIFTLMISLAFATKLCLTKAQSWLIMLSSGYAHQFDVVALLLHAWITSGSDEWSRSWWDKFIESCMKLSVCGGI